MGARASSINPTYDPKPAADLEKHESETGVRVVVNGQKSQNQEDQP